VRATRVKPAEYAGWRKFCNDADRALSVPLTIGPPT
jgi:hypothetical protein